MVKTEKKLFINSMLMKRFVITKVLDFDKSWSSLKVKSFKDKMVFVSMSLVFCHH